MDDGDPLIWKLLLQLFLIALNAIFACAEIAVISLNDKKLEKLANKGDKRAERLIKLTEQPAKFLSVIQVGITLAGFLASAFAADSFSGKLTAFLVDMGVKLNASTLHTIGVITITLILSYFTLVFGELVPKRIAMRHSEKIGLVLSGLLAFISKVFSPIIWLLTVSTNGVLRLVGIDPNAPDEEVTEEEIRLMVDAGNETGNIDNEKREFIHNIFMFDDRTAFEIMTHRTNVSFLLLEDSMEQWEKTFKESLHTIYPVCDETIENVVGILNIKDYFRYNGKNREEIINSCVKPAYFIFGAVRADVLLLNMKKNKNHFAIVIDEYGGINGIITISDLLEELVGNLDDDITLPEKKPPIERIGAHTWKIQGTTPLHTVSKDLGIELPHDDFNTFGGLVFNLLGKIPNDGDTPELEGFGLNIKVTTIKNHRMTEAVVSLIVKE
jgi:putative hemolysin